MRLALRSNEVVRLLSGQSGLGISAPAGLLSCTLFFCPAPQALPISCAKCEHELATQPALTFHPLGRMAIFMLWDIAEWSLCYPNSCQLNPVALLWEEAADFPSHRKSRAQGEGSGRAGKEPGCPKSLPGWEEQKAALMEVLLPVRK